MHTHTHTTTPRGDCRIDFSLAAVERELYHGHGPRALKRIEEEELNKHTFENCQQICFLKASQHAECNVLDLGVNFHVDLNNGVFYIMKRKMS